jgi:hypothetical protein
MTDLGDPSMSDDLTPEIIRRWAPADHTGLHTAWRELFPEFVGSEPEHPRRFDGRDLSPQQAGWVFEHWVCSAFRLVASQADRVRGPFVVRMESSERAKEELDGLATLGWQGFLIQSKLQADPIPFEPIARLYLQVGRRPEGTMGLFFARVYSEAAEALVRELRPIRVLLFRAEEIDRALTREPPLDILEMVRRKWRMAVEEGRPDAPLYEYSESD